MFKFVAENLDIRDFLKVRLPIKLHSAIHIAHGHADRFDGEIRGSGSCSERERIATNRTATAEGDMSDHVNWSRSPQDITL